MLTVCAWCKKTDAELYAMSQNEPVSHGVCEAHFKSLMEEIRERRDNQNPVAV